MKLFVSIAAIVFFVPSLVLAAPAWIILPTESSLGFQVSQAGGTIAGSFKRFDAAIAFDPKDLATSHVEIAVDIASITTGAAERDQELPKPDWFDIARFPRATFAASQFHALDNNNYVADGTLTLRDAKLPVSLPFTLDLQGDAVAVMHGQVDLDRTAFGIGQGQWVTSDMVGRKVTVIIRLTARRSA